MRRLYLDCGMGAAGDMLAGALLELLPDPEGFVEELKDISLRFRGSSNQRLIDLNATRQSGMVTLLPDRRRGTL